MTSRVLPVLRRAPKDAEIIAAVKSYSQWWPHPGMVFAELFYMKRITEKTPDYLYKTLTVVSLFCMLGTPAWADVITIPVVVKVSQASSGITPNTFQSQIFPNAELCLNQALKTAQAGFTLKFNLKSFQELSLNEESGISIDSDTMDTIEGKPSIKQSGRDAKNIEVIVSDKVQYAHVPRVLTNEMISFYENGAASKQKALINQAGVLCEKYFPSCDLTDPNKIENGDLKQIAIELNAMVTKYKLQQSDLSNTILVNYKFYSSDTASQPQIESPARQFAHESMHAWGGLLDRYYVGAAPNLMSSFECILDQEQIAQIKSYKGLP